MTRHNTPRLMTAPQPGETCTLYYYTDHLDFFLGHPGMGLKGGMTCDKRSQTGFKNLDIPVTWYLPVHVLSAALLSLILYGVSWT